MARYVTRNRRGIFCRCYQHLRSGTSPTDRRYRCDSSVGRDCGHTYSALGFGTEEQCPRCLSAIPEQQWLVARRARFHGRTSEPSPFATWVR